MQQLVQPGSGLGSVDCGVDELDLVAVYTIIYSVYIYLSKVYTSIYQDQITSGAMRSRTMKGRVSISIFILSPVILALSLPSMKMSWKWAAYAVDKVIMEP